MTVPPPTRPIACISGASSGIGAAFARRLASLGYDLILVARREELLEELAGELHRDPAVQVEILPVDLGDREQLLALASHLEQAAGLDLLVNNAGFGTQGAFLEVHTEKMEQMLDVHVRASLVLSRAVLPGMVQRGRGGVINVASLAGLMPIPGSVTYSATKAALVTFSEALSIELAGTGVKIQALCPGLTRSEFHAVMGIQRGFNFGPLWADPDEVAASSLAALRRGEVVCVPGLANRVGLGLVRLIPRGLYRILARRGLRRWDREAEKPGRQS